MNLKIYCIIWLSYMIELEGKMKQMSWSLL